MVVSAEEHSRVLQTEQLARLDEFADICKPPSTYKLHLRQESIELSNDKRTKLGACRIPKQSSDFYRNCGSDKKD